MLDESTADAVGWIISHVTVYQGQCAFWAYCVKEGRMTAREEEQLRRAARHRLETYIASKLREQRGAAGASPDTRFVRMAP
jgi:RecB family exonuclease